MRGETISPFWIEKAFSQFESLFCTLNQFQVMKNTLRLPKNQEFQTFSESEIQTQLFFKHMKDQAEFDLRASFQQFRHSRTF